ncbi:hypothetical protein CRM22_002096, partial [Opisthorchis felineus]
MSDLDALVSELGFHVEQLTNQLQDEKKHYLEVQNKLSNLIKEVGSKTDAKGLIEQEIKQLEASYFHQSRYSEEIEGVKEALAKQTLHLKKALEDIKDSNESMRKERTAFISQCRSKLKDYDECIWQNEKLRLFVDTWIKKSPDFELTGLPETIRETARKVANYYGTPLEETLETALASSTVTVHSENDKLNLLAPEKDEVPPTQTFQLPERDGDSHVPPEKLDQQHRETLCGPDLEDTSRLRLSALDTSALLTE